MGITEEDVKKLNKEFESKRATEVYRWAVEKFGDGLVLATSFSIEDVVLIDMGVELNPKLRIITLDTGRLPEETFELMDEIRRKYGILIESYFPDFEKVEELERKKGFYSFRESVENRIECCGIRKVEPLKRALKHATAWVTGLRREQSITRKAVSKIEIDDIQNKILKINPLMDWKENDVWSYIKHNKVPYNKLYDQGYRSIGCAPCTRTVKEGEDVRSGRWWWENPDNKECGLHIKKDENA